MCAFNCPYVYTGERLRWLRTRCAFCVKDASVVQSEVDKGVESRYLSHVNRASVIAFIQKDWKLLYS